MNYILMHRGMPVLELEIDEELGVINRFGEILSPLHLPVGLEMANGFLNRRSLNDWWAGRAIPISRQGLREALEKLNIPSPQLLLTRGYGLSLSDQYWLRPISKHIEWEAINFFENTFSEDVGRILFGGDASEDIDLISPDNTTGGRMKKKWIIAGGQRSLLKGRSPILYQEPLNEAFATAVMRRLKVRHVSYELIYENGKPYSTCGCFITSNTDFRNPQRQRIYR